MRFADLIEKKADGLSLSRQEIEDMIAGYVGGEIPDYQMAAMAMAIRFAGMTDAETAALTYAMMHSGDVVDLSDLPGIKLDKHSTGGVGDTTTLVVAPLVAACGGTVAKMSGRGLGHTGGTLDKLESVPGTEIEIGMDEFKDIVRKCGVAVIGQSGNLVPADKMLYALRDVTGTVRSIPLIASSIMSKKLAAGSDAIVLDVKCGSGAFMRTPEEAFALARLMTAIGKHLGRRVTAIVTDMDQPLGMAVGNALEVQEAVELLSGMIPETDPLYRVCLLLGKEMLKMGGLAKDDEEAEGMLKGAIADGSGLAVLKKMFALQHGDSSYIDAEKIKELVKVRKRIDVYPEKTGVVTGMHTERIGHAAQILGAGRAKKGDPIDPAVGLVMKVRLNSPVDPSKPLCTLYVNEEANADEAAAIMRQAVVIGDAPVDQKMVYGIVRDTDVE